MKADDMRTVLLYHEDFATEDTIVENYYFEESGA